MRQTRQVQHASNMFESMDPVRQNLLCATAGQCGRATAHCSMYTVRAEATMEYSATLAHTGTSEAMLYSASTLHRYGLPHEYARLETLTLPEVCPCCTAPLLDPG